MLLTSNIHPFEEGGSLKGILAALVVFHQRVDAPDQSPDFELAQELEVLVVGWDELDEVSGVIRGEDYTGDSGSVLVGFVYFVGAFDER